MFEVGEALGLLLGGLIVGVLAKLGLDVNRHVKRTEKRDNGGG